MNIRISHYQRRDSISDPIGMWELYGESLKGDQKWNSPDLAHQSDEETLIEFLGGPGPELEL
jgi:hypothetical protein